jgi:hypothetical protein
LGPFRCALCRQDLESSSHLFLDCIFSKQVWHLVYSELMHNIAWPSTCRAMIGKWSKVYKGSFSNKPTFHRVWKASIKFVCWKIWLARNKAIFKNKMIPPPFVVAHVMGQLGEYLTSRRIKVEKIEQLEKEEELWMSKMNVKICLSSKRTQRSFWQLQASPQEYNLWLSSQSGFILCFDGASKGNPGEAGVGGVLYGPRGNQILDFSWNLGKTSNNMVEAYAVYQGILLTQEQQLNHITIVGDSKKHHQIISFWEPILKMPNLRELLTIEATLDYHSSSILSYSERE